jgi:hypothetical protein
MSTRLGMGDGRCLTVYDSTRIYNDAIMASKNIAYEDNLSYRKYLQDKGPDAFVVPSNGACIGPGFTRQADSGDS